MKRVMSTTKSLPAFVKPMLAESGEPFDSDEHLFEIKWDGIRAMAYIEGGSYRLMSRRQVDVTERYPELDFLSDLPSGTLLDGELVVLDDDGKPDFRAVLSREQARTTPRYHALSRARAATFIVFDQLYRDFESLIEQPLRDRRQQLLETTEPWTSERFAVSDGVIGPGRDFFQQIVARDMEGVVAKRLTSRYSPGRRSDSWIKMRKSSNIVCAIIGYVPKGDDFESLIVAAENEGQLRCVGRVGNGFDAPLRDQINRLVREHECSEPLIDCEEKGQWLDPVLYCSVRFLEFTHDGMLREPVFERLISS